MGGTHDSEISRVDRGQRCHVESFGDSDDGSVDGAEVEVGVAFHEFGDALSVARGEVGDGEVTGGD